MATEYEITLKVKICDTSVLNMMPELMSNTVKEAIDGLGDGQTLRVKTINIKANHRYKVTDPKTKKEFYGWEGTLVSARSGAFMLEFDDNQVESFHEDELTFIS